MYTSKASHARLAKLVELKHKVGGSLLLFLAGSETCQEKKSLKIVIVRLRLYSSYCWDCSDQYCKSFLQ